MTRPRRAPRRLRRVSPGWSSSMRRGWRDCLWTRSAALPVGQRDRHDHLLRGSTRACPHDIGGAFLAPPESPPDCRAPGSPSDCGATVCGLPREHHVQLLLPTSLEAEFRRFEGLEALRRSAATSMRAPSATYRKPSALGISFRRTVSPGSRTRGEICFAVAAQDADAYAEARSVGRATRGKTRDGLGGRVECPPAGAGRMWRLRRRRRHRRLGPPAGTNALAPGANWLP